MSAIRGVRPYQPSVQGVTVTALFTIMLVCSCRQGDERTGVPSVGSPAAAKVMLIGLDGADWNLINPMIERGELRNLASLKEGGTWGRLRSERPLLSPLLWTTIATGKRPDEHGILNFVVTATASGKVVPVTSNLRRVKALWNIASTFEGKPLRVGFVGWLASWPAEEVNGFIVTDRLGYHAFAYAGESPLADQGNVFPSRLFAEIAPLLRTPEDIRLEELLRFVGVTRGEYETAVSAAYERDEPIHNARLLRATAETYRRVGVSLYEKEKPDLFGIYFELIDSAGHLFMRYAPPQREDVSDIEFIRYADSVEEFYRYQDEVLGDFLKLADDRTAVIVVSDHGFKSGDRRPVRPPDMTGRAAAAWHNLYGVFLAKGYGIGKDREITGARIVDIAPTVLALLGLPVAGDMPGRVLEAALEPAFLNSAPIRRIGSYEEDSQSVQGARAPIESPMDQAIIKRLEALGYVSPQEGALDPPSDPRVGAQEPDDIYSLRLLASIHAERKDYDEAIRLYERVLELRADDAGARSDLATLFKQTGQRERARKEFQRAIELDPDVPEIHNNLGELLRELGDLEGAVAAYQRALEIEPNHVEIRVNLGDAYRMMGKLDLAASELHKAVELGPDSARARNNYGVVLLLQDQLEEAMVQFEKLVELDPNYYLAYHNIGYIHLLRGDPSRAETAFRRALGLAPHYEISRRYLAQALRAQGRNEEAEVILQQSGGDAPHPTD